MPSHVAHLLFAEDALERSGRRDRLPGLLNPSAATFLVLGAQGPDIFYHNQHRRPTGLAYGSLMHRHGYGAAVSHMVCWAQDHDLAPDSWAGAWVIGFATHAILDRHTHPFINAHAGWSEAGRPETERYRSMHPFLERLIDVELLRRKRSEHPNDLDFYRRVCCGQDSPSDWVEIVAHGLRTTYPRAGEDSRLAERLRSAYLDSMGYYRFTNRVTRDYLERGLAREESGEIGSRWLTIVHPPNVPSTVDVMNDSRAPWPHPCPDGDTHTQSFSDCYERGVDEAAQMIATIVSSWATVEPEARRAIEASVGNWNLSDGRQTERPCPKERATPLPLAEVQEQIRESIRSGHGGVLS